MALAAVSSNQPSAKPEPLTHYDYIVVGTGPVGMHFIKQLLKYKPKIKLAVFGDEPWTPYNRIQLSSLVSGDIKEQSLYSSFNLDALDNVHTFYNNRITHIDRKQKKVLDSFSVAYEYGELILATGSRPNIPKLQGIDLKNVFTFRDLSDAQSLMARTVRTRRTVIIGGGLLGLEAARAMQRFKTEVHVIEHSSWLMFNQLDNRAGGYLKQNVDALGIVVHTNERVQKITGKHSVESIVLSNNKIIECDTVIVAAGIVANNELAKEAGLGSGKGIRVNDHLQTSDKNIYAIGECAEHNFQMYGVVAPGFEQASVLAQYFNGDSVKYTGSIAVTNLKVLNYPVFSIGNTGITARERECYSYQDHEQGIYRKIILINGRIRGAVGMGSWPGAQRIHEAVQNQRRIWPWQLGNFLADGMLWSDEVSENVTDWPSASVVCNCTNVTRGELSQALKQGSTTVDQLAYTTGASTVCGSCKNLVSNIVGGNVAPEPSTGFKVLLVTSIITLLAAIAALFLPALSYSQSIASGVSFDVLWRDGLYKQVSGFTLLGVSIFISIISLRKRTTQIIKKWDYGYWRLMHVVFGVVAATALLLHTGFRFGDNLNFYLMLIFSSLILVGSVASLIIGYEHKMPRRLAKQVRSYAVWSHILLLWPLPPLLGFHILKTYYF